jgi:beta-lactam-binding protein with PASTA domain
VRLVGTDATVDPNGARVMPDLTGRTLRSALAALAPLHVAVEIRGRGRVVRQAPQPGEPLRPGVTARLTLQPGAGDVSGSASRTAPRREASDLIR